MTRWDALSLAILALALCASCSSKSDGPSSSAAPAASDRPAPEPAKAPLTIVVAYGSEKKTWLEEQAQRFEARGEKTRSGRPIHIEPKAMGSGEAVQSIAAGELKPHVFSPASAVYVSLLNSAWSAKTGTPKPLSPAGDPLVLSPIVVAMWKPMAEVLGWPGKPIGWSDLVKVSADPKGWGALGHPEWGRFKLGHTHPEYSNSGLLAVLAEAYAGARKTRGLTAADLDAKATQDHLHAIEQTIVHYGKSTGFFSDKMLARGPAYLSAAVLYENLVIESYGKGGDAPFPIIAVYPVEGTFWSDHPYAVLDAAWVGDEEREGAQAFLRFLKGKPQQERALELGFRPADPSIPIGAPIDAAHGVDPKQPQTLLEVPDGATLEKLLGVWQRAKKTSDVILVFDKSGSMAGKPLAEAKSGARSFLDVLHDRDDVTLLFFDGVLHPAIGPKQLGKGKAELVARIDGTVADGKTALYDAVARAYDLALARAKAEPARIHAVVVMTDGKDEGSQLALDAVMKRFSGEDAPVKVFTIAYGDGADPAVLEQIAEAARGSSAKGATDTIVGVYKDMASFF
ncbi:extracellular solute-binding protein [Sorangium sp. So ce1389]|uniref:extracellular solute-binding protein n=1 Tax=Sorangium sp. So ce1389 TaxID=3133336 RepID=UPI003F63E44E